MSQPIVTGQCHYVNAVVIGRRFISGADPQNKRIAIATLLSELHAWLSGSYTKQG